MLLFSVVDFLTRVSDIAWIDKVENVELQSPNNISGVFNVTRFFETLEGNALSVISTIETTYDDKSRIGVALEFFELVNGVIDAELGRFLTRRNDLKIIKADDRSLLLVEAKRLEANKKFIDRFVLQFQNLQISLRVSDFANNAIKLSRPRAAPNISGSKRGLLIFKEKSPSGSFGKKFDVAHFVGTVNAVFSVFGDLFKKLPTEGSFASGRSRANDVKTRTEKLLLINIFKSGKAIGIIFKRVNVGFKVVGEIVRNVRRFGRKSRLVPAGKLTLSIGENFRERFFTALNFVNDYVTKFDKLTQVGFFLDDIGVVFSASSGESGVDKESK